MQHSLCVQATVKLTMKQNDSRQAVEEQLHYITNIQLEEASLNTQYLLQEHTMLQKGNLVEPSLCCTGQSEQYGG